MENIKILFFSYGMTLDSRGRRTKRVQGKMITSIVLSSLLAYRHNCIQSGCIGYSEEDL